MLAYQTITSLSQNAMHPHVYFQRVRGIGGFKLNHCINMLNTGLHLLSNLSFCNLSRKVILSISWISRIFWVHKFYVGGSCFSQLIVMHLIAAVSRIYNKSFVALPSITCGFTPNTAISGTLGMLAWKTTARTLHTSSQNGLSSGHAKNMCKWLPMCAPQLLQHLLLCVGPIYATMCGVIVKISSELEFLPCVWAGYQMCFRTDYLPVFPWYLLLHLGLPSLFNLYWVIWVQK